MILKVIVRVEGVGGRGGGGISCGGNVSVALQDGEMAPHRSKGGFLDDDFMNVRKCQH